VAEQALSNARKVREEGASAVEIARERLGTLEREVVKLCDVARLPARTHWQQRGRVWSHTRARPVYSGGAVPRATVRKLRECIT
jgi:hypothetical protein